MIKERNVNDHEKLIEHMVKIYQDSNGSWTEHTDDGDISIVATLDSWDDDEEWYKEDWEDPNDEDPEDFEAIAIRLMDLLTENKLDSYVILKDPIIAEWWGGIVKSRIAKEEKQRKIDEEKRRKAEDDHARQSLLARLTPEERRLLGLK